MDTDKWKKKFSPNSFSSVQHTFIEYLRNDAAEDEQRQEKLQQPPLASLCVLM